MEKAVTISHGKLKREFIISTRTKPHTFRNLIKKALSLHSEIKHFKSADSKFKIQELIAKGANGQDYEAVLEDESSDQRPLSEICSQKNMSRVSGRKNPPSQKELLDSKFYVDDFQLFMSEVSGEKNNRLYGIIFFNNRKRAAFLGKKILRELIFEFDRIQFFYALHPIKMHTNSALLGEVLIFMLFRGNRMIHQRQFPQQITAADEILNYIKHLVRLGKINFDSIQPRKTRNLIHVQEQRSFDQKIQNSPEKLSDFGGRPNRTAQIKIKPVTPDKQIRSRKVFVNPKPQSPIKSQITNQISFQNDFYQPQWFFEGDHLTRLQKGVLSALIKANDSGLLTFLNALNLKTTNKEALNIKLVKVYLREFIEEKFSQFTPKQKQIIEDNQQNRKSSVFTALLKLFKFGEFKDFIQTLSKELTTLQEQSKQIEPPTIKYSAIAKNADKNKTGFTLKLIDCEQEQAKSPYSQISSPFRHTQKVRNEHSNIASRFHKKVLEPIPSALLKEIDFQNFYNQAQRAGICDLICKSDAFMMQCFVKNPGRGKKLDKMSNKVVKKYLREVESRYEQIRERTVLSPELQLKMHKLQIFNGLVYYLYKQRIINKKQLKISFYLYTWSDLNILAAFEVYLADRNLEELIDTLYSIDYNYYLHGLYEIDHAEVEQFTYEIQSQLIILFLYEEQIHSGEQRTSLEKFIRAGDTSILKLYQDLSISNQDMIRQIISLGKSKTEELVNLNLNKKVTAEESSQKQKHKERCDFADEIVTNRYKGFNKKELLYYCITNNEPTITAMFERLDSSDDQHEWLNSFAQYIIDIDSIHMNFLLQNLASEANLDSSKLKECASDTIKGIYQAYLLTNDQADTVDSLQRAIRKQTKSSSP